MNRDETLKHEDIVIFHKDGECIFAKLNDVSLKEFTIPNSVSTIADAFYGCDALEKIVIPNSVKKITLAAFARCKSLKSIIIPNSVTSVGGYAFSHCKNLGNVILSNQLTSLSSHVFYQCESLKSISLPNSLKCIEKNAFTYCTQLEKVILSPNLKTIEEEAFCGCSNLTSIIIPESVERIGKKAFHHCPSLTIYCEAKSKPAGWDDAWNFDEASVVWDYKNNKAITSSKIIVVDDIRYKIINGAAVVTKQLNFSKNEAVFPSQISYENHIYSVKELESYAFSDARYLEKVKFPKSIESIGSFAFSGCHIKYIVIPDTIKKMGSSIFNEKCPLTICCEAKNKPEGWNSDWASNHLFVLWDCKDDIDEDGFVYTTIENIKYFIQNGKAIVQSSQSKKEELVIPYQISFKNKLLDVTAIAPFAFKNCSSLKKITLSENLIEIRHNAFEGCINLESILLPNHLALIDSNAFYGCYQLKSIIIPKSVVRIETDAFTKCPECIIYCEEKEKPSEWSFRWAVEDNIIIWDYKNNKKTPKKVYTFIDGIRYEIREDDAAIAIQPNLKRQVVEIKPVILYQDKEYPVTTIHRLAFLNGTDIKFMFIPKSVHTIESGAFEGCNNLLFYCESDKEAKGWSYDWNDLGRPIEWNTIYLVKDEMSYLLKDGIAIVTYPINLTIPDVTIPSEILYTHHSYPVTTIDDYAFSGCNQMKQVHLPESIKTIGRSAFSYCSSLKSFTIPKSVEKIDAFAFEETPLLEIMIPKGVTSIGIGAFSDCKALKIICEAKIQPKTWDKNWNISHCLVQWSEEEKKDTPNFDFLEAEVDGLKYKLGKSQAIVMHQDKAIHGKVVIPENILYLNKPYRVVGIEDSAFESCGNIYFVQIPNSVISIGKKAFYNCFMLKTILLPSSVLEIKEEAFLKDSGLTVYTDATEKQVGWDEEWIDSRCRVIWGGHYLFQDEIFYRIFHNEAMVIEQYLCLAGDIVIPSSISYQEKSYFVTTIMDYAFSRTDITSIQLPNSIKEIGESAFSRCSLLTNIEIPSGLQTIQDLAFNDCENLENIFLPKSIHYIGNAAFMDCTQLKISCETTYALESWHIDWNRTECPVEWGVCASENSTESDIEIEKNGIKYKLVDGSAIVTVQPKTIAGNIVIEDSILYENLVYKVTAIDNSAFENCLDLKSIILSNHITKLGVNVFSGCINLSKVILSSNLTIIDYFSFEGCVSLKKIFIPKSVKEIKDMAFDDCPDLTIYCEAESEPETWDILWNISDNPVKWGSKE